MKHNLTKRLMSLLLALVLVIGMLPMNVFAAQAAEPEVPDTTQDQQTDPAPQQEPDPSQTPAPAAEGTYHVSAVGGSHLSIRFNYTNAGGLQTHTYYTKASYIDQDVKIGAGVSLLFTLDSNSAYTVGSEDVTCTVGGEPVALVYSVTAGYPHFSLPDTLATGGDVVFTINEQLADGWIPVNTNLTNCTLEGSDLVKVGGTYTGKLTPAEGYILPTTITRTNYYGTSTVDVAEDGSFSFTIGSAETQITSTTIKASGVVPAAKIGTTLYRTLEEALADANANGGTIVILKDYVGIDAEEVNITGDVTIDANGFKFYTSSDRFGTMFVKNGAKLTLTGNGSCYGNYYDEAIRVEAGGTLQVDSGITFATDGANNILNHGTTTFSGTGHYVTNEGGVMHVYGTVTQCLLNSGGTMNIYDGALLSRTSQIPLQNRVKGTVNIYGGTIHGGSSSMSSSSGMVNIYGGTFYKAIEVTLDNTNYADDPQIGKYMISGGNFPNGLTVNTYTEIAEKTMVEDIIAEGKGVYADGSYVSDLNVASISGNVTVGEKQTVYVAAVALGTANEQKFETIEEAMDAAITLKGQTVSLLSDATFTDGASVTFDVNTFVKIDLCGYTLTLSDADGFVCANTFILDSSSAMSGKLVADEAIWTVCNFTIQSGTVDADIYVTDMSNLHGALYIKGGSYKGTLQRAGADNTISLQGGTFLGGVTLAASYDTTDDVELADLIPSGKAYYLGGSPITLSAGQMSITGGDVTIGEKPADTVMLEIGTTVTKYPTIDAAIAAVNSSTATQVHEITLLANVTAAADLMPNKMLVIDLCGKTLELGTNQIITSNGNSLVLHNTNSAVGTISGSNSDCLIEANSSVSIQTKVTVDNTAYDNAVSVTASGSLTSSGTIDSVLSVKDVTINAGTVRSIVNNGGAVYIRNGSVGAANVQYPIENNLEGTIYVYGGEITGSIGVIASSGKVYISGGTFTGKLISSLDNTNYSPAKTGSFELSGGTYKNGITVEGMYLADILKANHVYFQRSIEITPTATQTAITGSDVTVAKPVVAIVEIDGVSKEFTDIEAAFERAHFNSGAIVTLMHDVKIVESMYLPAVRTSYEMTLDLNGRTMVFYDDAYATYGYLTLCDSVTGGMITRTNSSDASVKCAISVHEDGHLHMTGGTVQGAYSEDDSYAALGAYGAIQLVDHPAAPCQAEAQTLSFPANGTGTMRPGVFP
ncbi:MAG: hypothetical protein IIY16_07085 [Oscillospiraceae bacterium]|nr:hypothetical protein [Oscillospiraceae bacterium]